MLHPFVSVPSAGHPRQNPAPVLTFSASVHVGLLCVALTSTGVVRRTHVIIDTMAEQVRFATLPYRAIPSRAAARSSRRAARARQVPAEPEFRLPPLLAAFDLPLSEPAPLPEYEPLYDDLQLGGSAGLTDDALHLGLGVAASPRQPGVRYNAYDEISVEKRVVPAAANRTPRYPSQMLTRGIEANFNVSFVVDTSGVVDRETVELPPSIQQEFTRAVVDVLFNWRFAPAEVGGRRVRQRVMQPFTFRLERQYGSFGRQ
jgi:TonB family protein